MKKSTDGNAEHAEASSFEPERPATTIKPRTPIDPRYLRHTCHYAVVPCARCCYLQGMDDSQ
jgi:hypothetical protein